MIAATMAIVLTENAYATSIIPAWTVAKVGG
jgi:hypothetical protein